VTSHPILAVAKKEYVENFRNAYVAILSVIFLILIVITAYYSRAITSGESGAASLPATVTTMQTFTGFMIPILALVAAYATFAGEQESGSLALLFAQPLTRLDVLLGKFLGLSAVLATTLLVGFGFGGLWVGSQSATTNWGDYAVYLALQILWASAWVAVTILFSSALKRRSTAIGGAIATWFLFSVLWPILFFVLLLATGNPERLFRGDLPDWAAAFALLNPNEVFVLLQAHVLPDYAGLIQRALVRTDLVAGDVESQKLVLGAAAVAWIVGPLAAAWAIVERKDL